jgi:hypothetical protein
MMLAWNTRSAQQQNARVQAVFFTINPTWSTLGFNPSTNHLSDDTTRDGNNALENEWLVHESLLKLWRWNQWLPDGLDSGDNGFKSRLWDELFWRRYVVFFVSPSWQIARFIPHPYQLILQSTCCSAVYNFGLLMVPLTNFWLKGN